MIVLNLSCSNRHQFEGWFASNEAFLRQADTRLISCPTCGDADITRLPSGPHVRRAAAAIVPSAAAAIAELARNCENVGAQFPEEARRIHYQEAPPRSIRGIATVNELKDLIEEGIAVLPLPVKDEVH